MEGLPPNSFRYKVLASAKNFKSSWIELGQYLFSVYKDKQFKEWGYLTFEAYCAKEIGIRQATAMKLLKSYAFLEREAPSFLKESSLEDKKPSHIPGYEAVNSLRLARENKNFPEKDYKDLRQDVLDHAKSEADVKKKVRYVLQIRLAESSEQDPQERKIYLMKRFLNGLVKVKSDFAEIGAPSKIIKQIDQLIE